MQFANWGQQKKGYTLLVNFYFSVLKNDLKKQF